MVETTHVEVLAEELGKAREPEEPPPEEEPPGRQTTGGSLVPD